MRPRHRLLLALLTLLPSFVYDADPGGAEAIPAAAPVLVGRLLVASPEMRDPRFKTSVVYMVDHDAGGALGIIVNKVYGQGSLANLMKGFGIDSDAAGGTVDLHFGGPVSPTAAFVLHSGDYEADRSRRVDGAISFTTDVEILRAIAAGRGPKRVLFALGCAGWGPGQLDRELVQGDWIVEEATEDLVFGDGGANAWEQLSGSSGVPL